MNFQEKLVEGTAELRARVAAFANAAANTARARTGVAAKPVETLKATFGAFAVAGCALNKVARRHAIRFVKDNASIAADARKDVAALARTTYASFVTRGAVKPKNLKAPVSRKRASAKAS